MMPAANDPFVAMPGPDPAASTSRRRFFQRSAVAAPAALLAAGASAHAAKPGKVTAKAASALPEYQPGVNGLYFRQIQRDENTHVNFLLNALGSNARPRPTFNNLEVADIRTFAETAFTLSNVGVGAYLGSAPVLFDKSNLAAAGMILPIEARHAGYLGTLLLHGIDLFDSPFEIPGTIPEIQANAAPFIASLNGGPPLSFSMTPSPENDIAIFNLALVLEYLERDFYNVNVPKFFPTA